MAFEAPESLPERIARHIGEAIIRQELAPGERIIEEKVVQELGVSRGSIREALQILTKQRLITLTPRKGARVTEITEAHIDSLYDILIQLWGLVAVKSLQRSSPEDRLSIQQILEKMESYAKAGDINRYFDCIFEYVIVAINVAKDILLEQVLLDLLPITRRVQFSALSRRNDEIKKNIKYFRDMSRYTQDNNAEMLAKTIKAFGENEKRCALQGIRDSLSILTQI